MRTELRMIYILSLKDGLRIQEIAGIDGWQPIIYTMVVDRAIKLCGRLNEITYDLVNSTQRIAKKYSIVAIKSKKARIKE